MDVLIGLNMMEIQPAGGMGVDKVGGVTALRSLFGCGWVLGGHHPDIHSQSQPLSTSAVTILISLLSLLDTGWLILILLLSLLDMGWSNLFPLLDVKQGFLLQRASQFPGAS